MKNDGMGMCRPTERRKRGSKYIDDNYKSVAEVGAVCKSFTPA